MRIGELAAAVGVTTKTIRFYEAVGVLPEPDRRPSGYREYDHTAVDRLAFVKAAQAAGLTLAEVGGIMDVRDEGWAPCEHVRDLLDEHAGHLQRRIAELTALRRQVVALRDRAATLDPDRCGPADVCHVIPHHLPADRPSA